MLTLAKEKQELTLSENLPDAAKYFTRALELMGRLIPSKEGNQTNEILIRGKVSYGLQRVPISVSLSGGRPLPTHVVIEAKCDDVYGEAAKQSIAQLLKIYETLVSGDHAAVQELVEKDGFEIATGVSPLKFFKIFVILILGTAAWVIAWFLFKG